ncbi:MAG: Hsp70 family protein, partial [Kibdelosporangium sp.]
EDLIRPSVEAGVEELLRTIRSAPLQATDLEAVVLTGGSARIPLVVSLVTQELREKAVVAAEPELACARGAAIAAQRLVPAIAPAPVVDPEDAPPAPPRPAIDIAPLDLPVPRSTMRVITGMKPGVLGAIGIAILGAGVALTLYLRPEPPSPQPTPAAGTSTVAPAGNTQPNSIPATPANNSPANSPATTSPVKNSLANNKPATSAGSTTRKSTQQTGEDGR